MSLALVNSYTSDNLGDAAIYETLVQLAAPLGVHTPQRVENWRHVRGLHAAMPGENPHAWLSVGGDIFNNARPRLVTRQFLRNVHELATLRGAQTFLFGQSIPRSCRGMSLQLLALALRRLSSVTVRDADSHARLLACGVRAELSYDIAFAYRPSETGATAAASLFESAAVDPGRAVLLSVRGFDSMYPHDNESFVARMATLALRLRARGHQPAVIVQSAAAGADSDCAVVSALRARVPGLAVLDPFELAAKHHPVDALCATLAAARATVAVRYHTAVLRLLAGRMPYALHYSNKGRDLVDRLGLPGCGVEHFEPTAVVAGIEDTMERSFDASAQRRHVQHVFRNALAKATAAGIPASVALPGAPR